MSAPSGKSRWGAGMWALFGGFALFVLALVVVAAMHEVDLVESDYYERGLAYQERIDAIARAADPARQPTFRYVAEGNTVTLCFPDGTPRPLAGSMLFFRPSSSLRDFRVPFALDSNACLDIVDSRLERGYWKLKCEWQDAGGAHYAEHALYIP
ncbi:MAG TPA: FixH family protein [bacterium]|nr:FixH family protein [bacterium]